MPATSVFAQAARLKPQTTKEYRVDSVTVPVNCTLEASGPAWTTSATLPPLAGDDRGPGAGSLTEQACGPEGTRSRRRPAAARSSRRWRRRCRERRPRHRDRSRRRIARDGDAAGDRRPERRAPAAGLGPRGESRVRLVPRAHRERTWLPFAMPCDSVAHRRPCMLRRASTSPETPADRDDVALDLAAGTGADRLPLDPEPTVERQRPSPGRRRDHVGPDRARRLDGSEARSRCGPGPGPARRSPGRCRASAPCRSSRRRSTSPSARCSPGRRAHLVALIGELLKPPAPKPTSSVPSPNPVTCAPLTGSGRSCTEMVDRAPGVPLGSPVASATWYCSVVSTGAAPGRPSTVSLERSSLGSMRRPAGRRRRARARRRPAAACRGTGSWPGRSRARRSWSSSSRRDREVGHGLGERAGRRHDAQVDAAGPAVARGVRDRDSTDAALPAGIESAASTVSC